MRVADKGNKTVEIKFYGEVGNWYNNGENFDRLFADLESRYDTINIRLHSAGGSVFEGNVIFNTIARSTKDVHIYIDGIAASMASIIILAAKKVYMAENAFIMIHNPSGFAEGNARDFESTAKLLRDMEANFAKTYATKTGRKEEDVKGWFDGTDHWFNADEAKAMGLVDAIVPMVAKNLKDLNKPEGAADIKSLYDRYAAALTTEPPKSIQNTSRMKQLLITTFALAGLTEASSDTAVLEALQAKMKGLEDQVKASLQGQIDGVIEATEKATGVTFTADQKNYLQHIGKTAGLDALKASLSFIKPSVQLVATATAPATISAALQAAAGSSVADDRKSWTWEQWQEKDPRGLEALEKSNWDAFKSLYKAEFNVEPQK